MNLYINSSFQTFSATVPLFEPKLLGLPHSHLPSAQSSGLWGGEGVPRYLWPLIMLQSWAPL